MWVQDDRLWLEFQQLEVPLAPVRCFDTTLFSWCIQTNADVLDSWTPANLQILDFLMAGHNAGTSGHLDFTGEEFT